MADTGSEVAQDLARTAAMLATRALDRAIAEARAQARMRERASAELREREDVPLPHPNHRTETTRDDVTLCVLPPDGVVTARRAEELEAALAARGATGVDVSLSDSGRSVVIAMRDATAARTVQETLEGLHADTSSTFDLQECLGLAELERATSRVTDPGVRSTEHVLVSFAGERADQSARAYETALRRAGLDATCLTLPQGRDAECAVAVSYPQRHRLDFCAAHARALAEIGTTARLAPYEPDDETRAREDATASGSERVEAEPREHVMAVFAGDPARDAERAAAYVEAMRARGYDPWHAAMGAGEAVHHTVELSYPASRRDRFAVDHVDALEEIGALDSPGSCEVDVLEEPVELATTLPELIEAHVANREPRGRHEVGDMREPRGETVPTRDAVEPAAASPFAAAPVAAGVAEAAGRVVAEAPGAARDARPLSARDYLALPARERARIPYEKIPGAAFGSETFSDVTRQAKRSASSLERGRERRIVPTIGERG